MFFDFIVLASCLLVFIALSRAQLLQFYFVFGLWLIVAITKHYFNYMPIFSDELFYLEQYKTGKIIDSSISQAIYLNLIVPLVSPFKFQESFLILTGMIYAASCSLVYKYFGQVAFLLVVFYPNFIYLNVAYLREWMILPGLLVFHVGLLQKKNIPLCSTSRCCCI